MNNFDQHFVAKINGVWVPVVGQIIKSDDGKWQCLFCKHNGYPYYISDNYMHFPDDITHEALIDCTTAYNCKEMEQRIAQDKANTQFRFRRSSAIDEIVRRWSPVNTYERLM